MEARIEPGLDGSMFAFGEGCGPFRFFGNATVGFPAVN
jgi:hypothetical protein